MSGRPEGFRLARYRGKFAVVWYEDGKRHRRSLGTADPTHARTALGEFIAVRERNTKPQRMTVAAILEAYETDRVGQVASPGAIRYSIMALLPLLGPLLPEHITESQCRGYVRARQAAGRKPGTARTELGVLSTALHWAQRKGWIAVAPYVHRPRAQPPRDRHLNRDEAARLIAAAEQPHVKLFILLALHSAGRAAALLELTWDRVDLGNNLIYLDAGDVKVGRPKGRATVPLTDTLRAALVEAKKGALSEHVIEWAGGPVKSVRKGFATAARRAGIKGATPHVCRHTAAVWMVQAGTPIKDVADYLGHSDSRVTERNYIHFSPERLRRASRALEGAA